MPSPTFDLRNSLARRKRVLFVAAGVAGLAALIPAWVLADDNTATQAAGVAADTVWVIVAACFVMFMQAGFAMLEVGFSRMKNVGTVVAKVVTNLSVSSIAYWAVGFGFAFGAGGLFAFIGGSGFFPTFSPGSQMNLPAIAASTAPAAANPAEPDTAEHLRFAPAPSDTESESQTGTRRSDREEGGWLRAPFGEGLLTDIEPWHAAERRHQDVDFIADYNRVDPLRLGLGWRLHGTDPWAPRLGGRIERAFGRGRTLYGAQIEQPLLPHGRLAVGASMLRRTDHNDLQQSGNVENSLTFLFTRADQRDYFEREGAGAYLSWRVPDFSTVSAHVRSDQYRSLAARSDARSWAHDRRDLRPNPAIDEGEAHAVLLRLERPARSGRRVRAGLYHWIEIERTGHGMGGDFEYTRALADLRSVVRLSPSGTFAIRLVAGHTADGTLPRQREFVAGGPDGLPAHAVDAFRGNRLALGQAEYDVGLWSLSEGRMEEGLHALAFVDVGRAWNQAGSGFDLARQKPAADAGFGLATADDELRLEFAKNLQDMGRDFAVHLRLQRPF